MRAGILLIVVSCAVPLLSQSAADRVETMAISPKDQSAWALVKRGNGVELWHAEQGGQPTRPIPITGTPKLDRLEDVITVTADGEVYLVGWAEDRMQLVKVTAAGETSFIRPLNLRSAHLLGLALAPRQDGLSLVLFGANDRGAFATKVDDSGLKFWTVDIDERPLAATFVDAKSLVDGSCILTGEVRDFRADSFGNIRSRTLLVQVNARGRIVLSKNSPGYAATVSE